MPFAVNMPKTVFFLTCCSCLILLSKLQALSESAISIFEIYVNRFYECSASSARNMTSVGFFSNSILDRLCPEVRL
jgi:hypothetical protein